MDVWKEEGRRNESKNVKLCEQKERQKNKTQ